MSGPDSIAYDEGSTSAALYAPTESNPEQIEE